MTALELTSTQAVFERLESLDGNVDGLADKLVGVLGVLAPSTVNAAIDHVLAFELRDLP